MPTSRTYETDVIVACARSTHEAVRSFLYVKIGPPRVFSWDNLFAVDLQQVYAVVSDVLNGKVESICQRWPLRPDEHRAVPYVHQIEHLIVMSVRCMGATLLQEITYPASGESQEETINWAIQPVWPLIVRIESDAG